MTDPEPPDDLRSALGRAIRARRAECGLTLRDLGELTGISYSYLAEIERGTSGKQVSTDKLVKIAEALEISPSHLLGRGERLRDSSSFRAMHMRDSEVHARVDSLFESDDVASQLSHAASMEMAPSSPRRDRQADELRWRITELLERADADDLRILHSLARDLDRRAARARRRLRRSRSRDED